MQKKSFNFKYEFSFLLPLLSSRRRPSTLYQKQNLHFQLCRKIFHMNSSLPALIQKQNKTQSITWCEATKNHCVSESWVSPQDKYLKNAITIMGATWYTRLRQGLSNRFESRIKSIFSRSWIAKEMCGGQQLIWPTLSVRQATGLRGRDGRSWMY